MTLFFWLYWVFVALLGSLSSCGVQASHCGSFSLQSVGVVADVGSVVVTHTGLVARWRVESSQARDWTHVPSLGKRILNHWVIREVPSTNSVMNLCCFCNRTSLVAQMVKHLPIMREIWVWSLGQEDPLEKEMSTHSSTLAWKIPWMEERGRLLLMGSQRVQQDWATSFHFVTQTLIGYF